MIFQYRVTVRRSCRTDLCLALGTSLSGLNADRMARVPAKRHSADRIGGLGKQQNGSLGLVIINLQETQLDELSSLRIYAELDDVLQMLAEELQLPPQQEFTPLVCQSEIGDVFDSLPYDSSGELSADASMTLDLREGSRIKVTQGNFAGC